MRHILCCWSLLGVLRPVPEPFLLSEPLRLASRRDPASVLLPSIPKGAALLHPVAVGSTLCTHRRTDTQKDVPARTVTSSDTIHMDTNRYTQSHRHTHTHYIVQMSVRCAAIMQYHPDHMVDHKYKMYQCDILRVGWQNV